MGVAVAVMLHSVASTHTSAGTEFSSTLHSVGSQGSRKVSVGDLIGKILHGDADAHKKLVVYLSMQSKTAHYANAIYSLLGKRPYDGKMLEYKDILFALFRDPS